MLYWQKSGPSYQAQLINQAQSLSVSWSQLIKSGFVSALTKYLTKEGQDRETRNRIFLEVAFDI